MDALSRNPKRIPKELKLSFVDIVRASLFKFTPRERSLDYKTLLKLGTELKSFYTCFLFLNPLRYRLIVFRNETPSQLHYCVHADTLNVRSLDKESDSELGMAKDCWPHDGGIGLRGTNDVSRWFK